MDVILFLIYECLTFFDSDFKYDLGDRFYQPNQSERPLVTISNQSFRHLNILRLEINKILKILDREKRSHSCPVGIKPRPIKVQLKSRKDPSKI